MARALLRHTVFDRLGNSQKNVTVHVYEPGTTTPIASAMHDARTGGNVLTNPLTTDVNGGVTAYLDETQEVDLLVVQGGVTRTVPSVATSSTSPLEISIAASNASAQAKAGADYVCDGVYDVEKLAAAIAAAVASGVDIKASEGQFNFGAVLLLAASGIRIRGSGMRATMFRASNGLNDNLIRVAAASGTLAGLVIEALTIDGNGANQTDGAAVEDRSGVYFKGSAGAGLADLVARDLYITGCRGMGMSLDGTSAAKLTRARLDHVHALGNGGVGYGFACDGVHVGYADDLTVEALNSQLNTDTGLAMDYCDGVHVADSVLRGNTGNQLAFARQSKNGTILGCMLDGLNGAASYGLRTGKFGDAGAAVSQSLFVRATQIIKNNVGIHLEDHVIGEFAVYCPGTGTDANTTPFESAGTVAFDVWPAGNIGINSQTGGTGTIASGATTAVVSHSLNANLAGRILAARHIIITPTNNPSNAVRYYVSAVSSTTFTVTLSGDPGASGFNFSWQARLDV